MQDTQMDQLRAIAEGMKMIIEHQLQTIQSYQDRHNNEVEDLTKKSSNKRKSLVVHPLDDFNVRNDSNNMYQNIEQQPQRKKQRLSQGNVNDVPQQQQQMPQQLIQQNGFNPYQQQQVVSFTPQPSQPVYSPYIQQSLQQSYSPAYDQQQQVFMYPQQSNIQQQLHQYNIQHNMQQQNMQQFIPGLNIYQQQQLPQQQSQQQMQHFQTMQPQQQQMQQINYVQDNFNHYGTPAGHYVQPVPVAQNNIINNFNNDDVNSDGVRNRDDKQRRSSGGRVWTHM
ncbi:Nipblb [Acrasis kona]|uniref:Nipblb n=1 Tax=Acrasis kona TaxID=1008807 RepID=A0AAW2YMY5_9EUKA